MYDFLTLDFKLTILLCSNIPSTSACVVFVSHLIRYVRACSIFEQARKAADKQVN